MKLTRVLGDNRLKLPLIPVAMRVQKHTKLGRLRAVPVFQKGLFAIPGLQKKPIAALHRAVQVKLQTPALLASFAQQGFDFPKQFFLFAPIRTKLDDHRYLFSGHS